MALNTSRWHHIILPQMVWQKELCESLRKALRRWVRGAFKRSYLDSFSVIEQPLTVRLEYHLQSYG